MVRSVFDLQSAVAMLAPVSSENWRALRQVGQAANQRLCDGQAADARPAPDLATLTEVTRPSVTTDGLHAPGLRFADPG